MEPLLCVKHNTKHVRNANKNHVQSCSPAWELIVWKRFSFVRKEIARDFIVGGALGGRHFICHFACHLVHMTRLWLPPPHGVVSLS